MKAETESHTEVHESPEYSRNYLPQSAYPHRFVGPKAIGHVAERGVEAEIATLGHKVTVVKGTNPYG